MAGEGVVGRMVGVESQAEAWKACCGVKSSRRLRLDVVGAQTRANLDCLLAVVDLR